ncbi:MAG: hypothetical protein L6Q73_17390, partial [Aquabacterium sp.]|nr:hypothetical protein [Aquabacterium sp.]
RALAERAAKAAKALFFAFLWLWTTLQVLSGGHQAAVVPARSSSRSSACAQWRLTSGAHRHAVGRVG